VWYGVYGIGQLEKTFRAFLQVTVAIRDIEEGSHERSFELKDLKDASRTMAKLKVPRYFHIPLTLKNIPTACPLLSRYLVAR
jgi:hypothetical protein